MFRRVIVRGYTVRVDSDPNRPWKRVRVSRLVGSRGSVTSRRHRAGDFVLGSTGVRPSVRPRGFSLLLPCLLYRPQYFRRPSDESPFFSHLPVYTRRGVTVCIILVLKKLQLMFRLVSTEYRDPPWTMVWHALCPSPPNLRGKISENKSARAHSKRTKISVWSESIQPSVFRAPVYMCNTFYKT